MRPTYAWISPNGHWLTYSESRTHTGVHKSLGQTTVLSQAYVGPELPKYNERSGIDPQNFIAIPATVLIVRTVTLGAPIEP